MEHRENEHVSETATLSVEVVKNIWITFLQRDDLNLDIDKEDIEIIRKKVSGGDFFNLTAEKLKNYGLQLGPASRIAKLVKEIKGEQGVLQDIFFVFSVIFANNFEYQILTLSCAFSFLLL